MTISLDYVKEYRHMPWVKRGMAVDVNGKKGRVTSGGNGGNIRVRFDGETFSRNCHPHWQTTYFDKSSNVIAQYTKEK